MSSNFKGTKTEQNIIAAFSGESQARTRYTYYAEKAEEEGREDIARLFSRMAKNELAHAKIWFKLMNGGIPDSNTNLLDSISRENGEWKDMYPGFAAVAREEGFDDIADIFMRVADIEASHEKQFMESLLGVHAEGAAPKATEPAAPVNKPKVKAWCCAVCGQLLPFKSNGEIPYTCATCGALGHFEQVMVDADSPIERE